MSVGNKILTTVCACTINALQGNVPAITLALGVATHRTSFLANNVSYRYGALFITMTGKSNVSELVCEAFCRESTMAFCVTRKIVGYYN